MNIFRLDKKYSLSANYHCDKHVVKNNLEVVNDKKDGVK